MKRNRFRRIAMGVATMFLALSLAGCAAGAATDSEIAPQAGRDAGQYDQATAGFEKGADMPAAADMMYPADGTEDVYGDEAGRMIIRNKVLRVEVPSTAETVTKIRDLTRSHKGSVSDMQVATDSEDWVYHNDEYGNPVGDGTALRGWVTVRVPSDSYEDFIADVSKLGTIKYQSESTNDVTQEHVDLSARLKNLQAQEARLRDFFDAAKNVKEMLSIEEELGRVRGDIESLDAQVTYLERQAAMATVTVELVEPRAVVRPEGESWGFSQAITDGIRGAASVIAGALSFLIATSPLWIIGAVLFLPIRRWLRRRKSEKAPLVPATTTPAAPAAEGETAD